MPTAHNGYNVHVWFTSLGYLREICIFTALRSTVEKHFHKNSASGSKVEAHRFLETMKSLCGLTDSFVSNIKLISTPQNMRLS